MADPTEAEIRAQIGYGVLGLEEARQLAEADATNLLGVEDQLVLSLEGDYSLDVLGGWRTFRARYSESLSQSTAFAVIAPSMFNYGKFIRSPFTTPNAIFRDLYDYFVANTLTVEERGFTFGAAAAAVGNTGTGVIHRLNVDENGFDIDVQTADTKTITCTADEHSGATEHAEVFEIRGQERTQDFLSLTGGSAFPNVTDIGELTAVGARDSQSYITNPSFTNSSLTFVAGFAAPALVTDVTGWTLDAIAGVQLDQNVTYRDSEGEATPVALRFDQDRVATQNLNVQNARVDFTGIGGFGQELDPLFVQVAVYRGTNADGTLTLTFGSRTAAVNVALLANGTWNLLYIAIGVGCYFDQWNQENPTVAMALAGNTVGYVNLDDVIVTPWQSHDGGWYLAVGGATPFLRTDTFAAADTVLETGVLQKWFVRSGLGYLPSAAAGAASWGDPPPTPTTTG